MKITKFSFFSSSRLSFDSNVHAVLRGDYFWDNTIFEGLHEFSNFVLQYNHET